MFVWHSAELVGSVINREVCPVSSDFDVISIGSVQSLSDDTVDLDFDTSRCQELEPFDCLPCIGVVRWVGEFFRLMCIDWLKSTALIADNVV